MGRKNGKTELIAALALCHLCGPEAELNGEIYSAAADAEQAWKVFKAACDMVRADDQLNALINIIESKMRMVHYDSGSFFQVLSKAPKGKHGFNPTVVIYDELAQANGRALYDVLATAGGARAQPLFIVISTMSNNRTDVMSELVDYGRKVNAGTIPDPTFVAFIYEIPEDLDVFDEKNWHLANPALGDFRSIDEMREFAAKARHMPSLESAFRNLYCNQAVNAEAALITAAQWKAVEADIDLDTLIGNACIGALDLSGKNDLTALTLLFHELRPMQCVTFFWTPKDTIVLRGERDKVPYALWDEQKHLEATPGKSIDYAFVARKIGEAAARYELREIAYDRYRIDDLKRELDRAGIDNLIDDEVGDGVRLIKFGQGFIDMGPAVDALETAILNDDLRHDRNPVMRMCMANAVIVPDAAGNRKFTKAKSTGRIDGAVTLAMAVRRASVAGEEQKSVYETSDDAPPQASPTTAGGSVYEEDGAIDYAILNDLSHPRFPEMKRRFEEWQASQPDED